MTVVNFAFAGKKDKSFDYIDLDKLPISAK